MSSFRTTRKPSGPEDPIDGKAETMGWGVNRQDHDKPASEEFPDSGGIRELLFAKCSWYQSAHDITTLKICFMITQMSLLLTWSSQARQIVKQAVK